MNIDLNILTFDYVYNFIFNNFFIIFLAFLTYIGICLDERFKFKNKVFIGLGYISFFFFLLFFNVNDISI